MVLFKSVLPAQNMLLVSCLPRWPLPESPSSHKCTHRVLRDKSDRLKESQTRYKLPGYFI